jgi:hypothetical protein
MTNSLDLVTRASVLNLFRLAPSQLDQLLSALHAQVYQLETRLYIRRDVKRLISSLLEPRYANTPLQQYLDALESMTFLYRCTNCGELLFFTELQLGEQLSHHCLRSRRTCHERTGSLELVGSGPLRKLVDRHCRLFPLEEAPLPLSA